MTDDATLDDTDRAIVLAVHRSRRATGVGPTWVEVRRAVPGLDRPDIRVTTFRAWWSDPANREAMENSELEGFFAKHPDTVNTDAAWANYCYRIWRARQLSRDPLAQRLFRLRWLGYVRFSREERSLDIGRLVRAQLRRQRTPSTA